MTYTYPGAFLRAYAKMIRAHLNGDPYEDAVRMEAAEGRELEFRFLPRNTVRLYTVVSRWGHGRAYVGEVTDAAICEDTDGRRFFTAAIEPADDDGPRELVIEFCEKCKSDIVC